MPHEQAARLPLLVLPPNRLRLLNPVQGLQALVTRELGRPDGTRRLRELAALLPGEALRLDFHRFLSAMLPRRMRGRPRCRRLDAAPRAGRRLVRRPRQPLLAALCAAAGRGADRAAAAALRRRCAVRHARAAARAGPGHRRLGAGPRRLGGGDGPGGRRVLPAPRPGPGPIKRESRLRVRGLPMAIYQLDDGSRRSPPRAWVADSARSSAA